MGRLSDVAANNDLDVRFGRYASTAPASYWVGLSATKPTDAGGNVTEPSGNGYARVEVPNDAAHFPAAAGRVKTNGKPIQWPTATAAWGALPYSVLYDSASGGVFQGFGDNGGLYVDAGAAPRLDAGAVTIMRGG